VSPPTPGDLQAAARRAVPDGRLRPVPRQGRTEFLAFCRYLRSLHPAEVRIATVLQNFSPHLSTKTDSLVGDWAAANNVELAYVPFYGSWLNRIETSSPPCATSLSTAPTTTATPSKPA